MRRVVIGFKTSPQAVDWSTLDETWAAAGELDVLESGWLNDHLTEPGQDRGGASWEPLTLVAALAHRVPGRWIGVAVLSNTFRDPAVLAKQATALDTITGGRFIIGLGAGWHQGEHDAFGIRLAPIGERMSRLESAVETLQALFSTEAGRSSGVSRDDPFQPLRGAVNLPPPVTPGGPPIWLGGQRPRGLRMAARLADGWVLPAGPEESIVTFTERRTILLRDLGAVGRDASAFTFAAQLPTGTTPAERAEALAAARTFVDAGAGHVILGMPARLGPEGLRAVAREIAEPLRAAIG